MRVCIHMCVSVCVPASVAACLQIVPYIPLVYMLVRQILVIKELYAQILCRM